MEVTGKNENAMYWLFWLEFFIPLDSLRAQDRLYYNWSYINGQKQ